MARKKKTKLTFNAVKVGGVLVGVVLIVGILIYQTQGFLTQSKYFQVKSVVVDPSLAFIKKGDLTMLRGKNIFQVDLKGLKSTLSRKYPQITELKVTRRYPNQIQLLARKRHPFAQTKVLNRTVTLDGQSVILSTTDGRDKSLPLVSGIESVNQKLYLGSTLKDEQLKIALSIIQAKELNEDLGVFEIEEVDVKNLSKINVYLTKKLLVIVDKDKVAQKMRNLGLVLNQTHIELADIKYIDLRFKDPIIGKK